MATRGRPRKTEEEKKAGRLRLQNMSVEERVENGANYLASHNRLSTIVNSDDDDAHRYMRNMLEILELKPIDFQDYDAVQNRISEYFEIVSRNGIKPGVAGLACAMNTDRRTLQSMVTGKPFNSRGNVIRIPSEVTTLMKKVYAILEMQWEDNMQNGKINPASGIFLGKNNFGYSDVQEHVVTPAVEERRDYDIDSISKRYLTGEQPIDSEGSVE